MFAFSPDTARTTPAYKASSFQPARFSRDVSAPVSAQGTTLPQSALSNTDPAWLHGKVVGAPVVEDMDMQEAAVGYTHVVQYTYKDTNHQLRGLCDTLLTRERYGVDKAWVLLDKVEE